MVNEMDKVIIELQDVKKNLQNGRRGDTRTPWGEYENQQRRIRRNHESEQLRESTAHQQLHPLPIDLIKTIQFISQ